MLDWEEGLLVEIVDAVEEGLEEEIVEAGREEEEVPAMAEVTVCDISGCI